MAKHSLSSIQNAKRPPGGEPWQSNHGCRKHRVDVATQLFTQTRHAFEAGHAIAVGAPPPR